MVWRNEVSLDSLYFEISEPTAEISTPINAYISFYIAYCLLLTADCL